MSKAYYNEIDPFAASWLRELITDGLIAPGDVDERSIKDVKPKDLVGYTQCHFFAGIGGWSYALRLAGWPDDRAVWTGSCPCQPFSSAGKRKGESDPRHLWPDFYRRIKKRRPPVVFGEQVASKDGRVWLDRVRTDLEKVEYAVGAADLCAAGVGAPHIRQRLWWVADIRLVHPEHGRPTIEESGPQFGPTSAFACWLPDAARPELCGLAPAWNERPDRGNLVVLCDDGKARRIPSEPSLFPLADGIPNRIQLLRGAGNAIVPQVAAEFIAAYMEAAA